MDDQPVQGSSRGTGRAATCAGSTRRWTRAPHRDLLVITHEHVDHNGADAVGDSPPHRGTIDGRPVRDARRRGGRGRVGARRPGRHRPRPEHDLRAGQSTASAFYHIGDFGQAALRPEQRDAIGDIDLLFVPVGGGPTLDAAGLPRRSWTGSRPIVVPMDYRT